MRLATLTGLSKISVGPGQDYTMRTAITDLADPAHRVSRLSRDSGVKMGR